MVTFFITNDERRRAQKRAAELDIEKSHPPGQQPYVWDNRLNSVKRWYDYASPEDKIGTVYFRAMPGNAEDSPSLVQCTTEITHHPPEPERRFNAEPISDPKAHRELADLFFQELLGREWTQQDFSAG